jgi:hypothetical protein
MQVLGLLGILNGSFDTDGALPYDRQGELRNQRSTRPSFLLFTVRTRSRARSIHTARLHEQKLHFKALFVTGRGPGLLASYYAETLNVYIRLLLAAVMGVP